jgi:hypothetical protein
MGSPARQSAPPQLSSTVENHGGAATLLPFRPPWMAGSATHVSLDEALSNKVKGRDEKLERR